MRKLIIPLVFLALVAPLLSGCENQREKTDTAFSGLPPDRYQGDTDVWVKLSSNPEADCYKAGLARINGTVVYACTVSSGSNHMIIIKNPCDNPSNEYRRNFCHEIGHVNGWPGNHPK